MLPILEELSKIDLSKTQLDFDATSYILQQGGMIIQYIRKQRLVMLLNLIRMIFFISLTKKTFNQDANHSANSKVK